ncbi:MAG TPA: DinB family protein [Chitinophagaceae bacterium]|nr:DinB family protein [Chitinophagaceae bacterium]
MAKFKSEDLTKELKEDVQHLQAAAEHLKNTDKSKLVYAVNEGQWSVVQCLQHLNAYGRHYLPAIEKAIAVKTGEKNAWFNSGFLGDYFTKSMKPTNVYEIRNKMKAMKSFTFPNSLNVDTVIKEYIDQKTKLQQLLDIANDRDLNSIRLPITLTKLIKLKLGDLFRFLIAHEQRHMIQARNTLKSTGVATDKFPVILQVVQQ